MPLYEYQCDACSNRFERIQKFSDPPVDVCPACGGAVRKLLSSPAIQFKGSGWYITDYAKKSSSDGKPSATSETKSGESTSTASAKESASSTPSSGSGSTTSGNTSSGS